MTLKFAARFAAMLAVASSAVVISVASPAQAFIGLYRVDATSVSDATSPKNISVTCNANDDLISVAGNVIDGFGDVILTRAYLDPTGLVATASAIEAIPTGVPWSIQVFGVCAPNGSVINRSIVETVSASNALDKVQTAVCPAGDNLLGDGFLLENAFGNVSIDEVNFNAALTSVSVTAYNNAAVGNYTLTVQAVCGDPLPLMSLQTDTSANNAISPKTVTSPACPAGSQVSAVGNIINGALGNAAITTLNPRPQLLAGETIVREVGPFAGNWTSQIEVICIG